MLVLDQNPCRGVKSHVSVVVGRTQGSEKLMRDGEERHVHDVRIVLARVGDYAMHVVIPLPPTDRKTTQEICNEDPNTGVRVKSMCYTHMTGVMSRECQPVPE